MEPVGKDHKSGRTISEKCLDLGSVFKQANWAYFQSNLGVVRMTATEYGENQKAKDRLLISMLEQLPVIAGRSPELPETSFHRPPFVPDHVLKFMSKERSTRTRTTRVRLSAAELFSLSR